MKAASIPKRLAFPITGIALNNKDRANVRPAVKITKAMPFKEFNSIAVQYRHRDLKQMSCDITMG